MWECTDNLAFVWNLKLNMFYFIKILWWTYEKGASSDKRKGKRWQKEEENGWRDWEWGAGSEGSEGHEEELCWAPGERGRNSLSFKI